MNPKNLRVPFAFLAILWDVSSRARRTVSTEGYVYDLSPDPRGADQVSASGCEQGLGLRV